MLEEIKTIIKGEVSFDAKELLAYSRDASIFEIRPRVVVSPKNVEDLKKLVVWTSAHKGEFPDLSLTIRSAGTDMSGGPLNDSIILDMTKHFKHVEAGRHSAVAEPGVYYRDFEKETLKKNLLLPSYPASREICTIGGMVANNAGGEKSLRYGKTADYVEELNVVLSDGNEYVFKVLNHEELRQKKSQNDFEGELYRKIHELLMTNNQLLQKAKPGVSKNSAGYALWDILKEGSLDLTKLITGSQGTLGIITKVKLRLIKPKKYSKLIVIFLKKLDRLGDLVVDLNKYQPESMESYDDNTFKLTLKILPDLIKKIDLGVLFRFIPDSWAMLTGGIPKMVILAEFTGDEEEGVEHKVQSVKRDIDLKFKVKARIAKSEADIQKYWTIRRESFNLLRKHIKGKKTAPFIDDIIVKPEHLPEFLPELNKILNNYENYMTHTITGHPGDGNFHIIPLMDLADEKSRAIIPELSEKVYDLVIKFGGSITAEHNDGLIRTPYLEKMYGAEVYNLFKEVKQIFDPQNIFNSGKKVPLAGLGQVGSLNYAMKHIN